jgi:hypothetical protein
VQYPNWLLRYLIFQEGIHIHVEPGNIFRRKAGINMTEEILEDEELFITSIDAEGNITKIPVV